MIDELRRDAWILQVLLDRPRVFVVDFLRRFRRGFLRLEAGTEDEGEERRVRENAGFHAEIVIRNRASAIRNSAAIFDTAASRQDTP